jgi:phospholipid/cholesterol/gamma-HCH transport system ATP-binding protein
LILLLFGSTVSLLNEGKIIFSGAPAELKSTDNPYVRQFLEGRAEGPIKVHF